MVCIIRGAGLASLPERPRAREPIWGAGRRGEDSSTGGGSLLASVVPRHPPRLRRPRPHRRWGRPAALKAAARLRLVGKAAEHRELRIGEDCISK